MKILIGIPCMETLPVDFVNCLLRLKKPVGSEIMTVPLSLVYVARETIIGYAIQNNFDYVMFIDSDMIFQSDSLQRLIDANKDIVSGLAFMRKPPYNPCIYSKLKLGEGTEIICETAKTYGKGIQEIEGVGAAFCLVKTKVFKDIYEKRQQCFFPIMGYGEDLAFCLRARSCGYKIYVDTDNKIGHIGQIICTESTYKAWNEVGE
jgi:GT2 family glycosyltransferase